MNRNVSHGRPHYAWCILIACCLIQGGIIGLVQNCRGLFYHPVCSELGFTVSAFTLYSTAHGIGAFFVLPFAGRWLAKYPIRLVLGAATFFFAGSTAMMGLLNTLPAFYFMGAVQGIAGAFLIFLPVPILLNNWFHHSFGMAMGISASFSGGVGVLANPIFSWCISSFGWRYGYLILGVSCFLMAAPAVLFLAVRAPADRGLLPYGAVAAVVSPSEPKRVARAKTPLSSAEKKALVCAIAFAACAGIVCSYCQHFANYAASLGLAAKAGAMLVSFSMVGNIVGKLGLGAAGDRYGVRKTIFVSSAVVGIAYLVMTIPTLPALFFGALVSGISMPLSVVCVPMLVKALFSFERYAELYSYVTMATSLMSSLSLALIGGIYDLAGSYLPALWLGTGLTAVAIALTLLAFRAVAGQRS